MTPMEAMMRKWLVSGDPVKARQAEERIALGFTETPDPQPPPLLTRLANFATAAVQHVAAGLPTADEGTIAARLAVCNGPPEGPACDQRLPGGSCAGCGCNLAWKASWLDQDCPMGKWPAVSA